MSLVHQPWIFPVRHAWMQKPWLPLGLAVLGHVIDITTTGWNWALVIDALFRPFTSGNKSKKTWFSWWKQIAVCPCHTQIPPPNSPKCLPFRWSKGAQRWAETCKKIWDGDLLWISLFGCICAYSWFMSQYFCHSLFLSLSSHGYCMSQ